MKWALCGLTFALAVVLAIGTAAIRAGNIHLRKQLEREYRGIEARAVELGRLSVQALDQVTPERLAVTLRELLEPAAHGAARSSTLEAASWQ